MNDSAKEIKPDGNTEIAQITQESSPMSIMIQAKQAGFSVEEIREMMDLQDRNDARLAKQAFDKAMAEFKRDPPDIYKDKNNDQYGSTYTSIGNMVNTVNKAMGPFGLNARWAFPPPVEVGCISCTCILAHELGHEERVTIESPIDNSGAKNPLQGRKSTRTYLKLETFEAVTGMASAEGNIDDDGNSAVEYITEEQALNIQAALEDVGGNKNKFLELLAAKSFDLIRAKHYDKALDAIEQKRKAK